jgi:signal transduction histidine kinase
MIVRTTSLVPIVGIWTIIVVLFTTHEYLSDAANARHSTFLTVLYWSASEWYTWALMTPAIFALTRQFRVAREGWLLPVAAHSVFAVIFSLAQILLAVLLDQAAVALFGSGSASVLTWLSGTPADAAVTLGYLTQRKIGFNLAIYGAIALAGHLLAYYALYRNRELQAARLESQLMRARLDMLRNQLEPHFLFNALNAIAELVHRDPDTAEQLIEDLADLLRRALDAGADEVSLGVELQLLEAYCAIERARLGERLRINRDIDPATYQARVPVLLLQPLVENAVRYAVQPRAAGGSLVVRTRRFDDRLLLEVEDDGPGLSATVREGIGLSNIRSRLAALYGASHRFELSPSATGGSRVSVELPWNTEPRRSNVWP